MRRLEKIIQENLEFEKKSPYNFCDRWCQRCLPEKQNNCRLYLDEFEQKVTCIAYKREPGDPEVIGEIIEREFADLEEIVSQKAQEFDLNLENPDQEIAADQIDRIQSKIVQRSLQICAERYMEKAQGFLKDVFYPGIPQDAGLNHDLETVSWYCTLLPAKTYRILYAMNDTNEPEDLKLADIVAQAAICK